MNHKRIWMQIVLFLYMTWRLMMFGCWEYHRGSAPARRRRCGILLHDSPHWLAIPESRAGHNKIIVITRFLSMAAFCSATQDTWHDSDNIDIEQGVAKQPQRDSMWSSGNGATYKQIFHTWCNWCTTRPWWWDYCAAGLQLLRWRPSH